MLKPQLTIHLQPHSSGNERSLIYRILTFFIAVFFILVVAVSALFILAKDSLPTDSLYSIKRAGENVLVKLFSFHPTLSLNIEFILLEQRIFEFGKVLRISKDISLANTIIEEAKKIENEISLLPSKADRIHYYEGLQNMLVRQDAFLNTSRQVFLNETQNNSNSIEKIATIDFLKSQIIDLRNEITTKERSN